MRIVVMRKPGRSHWTALVWEGAHRVLTRKPGDRLTRVALAVDQVESKARKPV
jgi:hypothetical protein